MKKSKYLLISILMLFSISFLTNSCKTPRKTGFELQKEIYEEEMRLKYGDEEPPKEIYLSDTKPIDSVDVNLLIFDMFRFEAEDYPKEVRFFARVYDSLGNFVTHMADPYKKDKDIEYFTSVREELGKNYKIRHAPIKDFKVREFGADDSIAYDIVLTVDYSGSMDAILSAIFEGTELFVSMKFPQDRIALGTFNRTLDVKVPLLKDTADILRLYRAKRNEGLGLFTGVFDAIYGSINLLKDSPKDQPKIVVILSDGDDNYSKKNLDSLIRKAKELDVHVFCVAFGYSKDESLRLLSQYTGGKFYKAHTKEQLIAIFKDIYMSLRYFYRITYVPPTYWGYHHAYAAINVPGRADSLVADGFYDTTGWLALSDTVVRPINFDFDKAIIKEDSYLTLDELVDLMMTWPNLKFDIQGHTDNIGTKEYNEALSERRAQAVYDALVERGIDERRLRYRGFGFAKPVASNETEAGRSKNRRTEFIIIAK
ncbi:MAG: OmpA family protein [Candidatus Kapabacteria bacterium]|nr:OmpA family protein [Ignavibacteriota bacterium]MCW5883994.1 OmpA family protein [Candidatus Kapabacteria bacterium]